MQLIAPSVAVVISVVLLSLFASQGEAIRCFECNSHNDTRCSQDIPPKELSIECGDRRGGATYKFCRKITQVIEFSVNSLPPDSRVIRGCGWDDSNYKGKCYQRSGFGGRQEVCACYEDECNGTGTMSLTVGSIVIAFAAFICSRLF